MANQIYFKIISKPERPICFDKPKGQIELHVSSHKKEIAIDNPDCLSKAIRFYDKGSYKVAEETASKWYDEMIDRFSAIEV